MVSREDLGNRASLRRQLPDGARVEIVPNGVDLDYFAPDASLPSPYDPQEQVLVFTGAMDYWPNVDAVTWFVQDMLPALDEDGVSARADVGYAEGRLREFERMGWDEAIAAERRAGAERRHGHQAIHGSALEHGDQHLAAGACPPFGGQGGAG